MGTKKSERFYFSMSKCTCEYCPTIIVPGIGQSKVDLYSSDNKRIKSAWPMDIDTKPLVKKNNTICNFTFIDKER